MTISVASLRSSRTQLEVDSAQKATKAGMLDIFLIQRCSQLTLVTITATLWPIGTLVLGKTTASSEYATR